jgi:uncharacterized membrane protein YhaH (DUF805 family)
LIFLVTIAYVVGGVVIERTTQLPGNEIGFVVLSFVYVATTLPWFAAMVRRPHDVDKSGWWLLAAFIPFGIVVLITFWVRDGIRGDNRFGHDPKVGLSSGQANGHTTAPVDVV